MARLIVTAFSEDTVANPGNRQLKWPQETEQK